MEDFMLPCLNKQLFGVDCLGCGAQRAFLLVLRGEFTQALKMYPAVYSLLFLLFFLLFNVFIKFKHDWLLKVGLILVNAVIIIGSYFMKIGYTIF